MAIFAIYRYHIFMKASFEWDDDKNRINQKKHRISFKTAQYAFSDPNRLIFKKISITVLRLKLDTIV